MFEEIDGEEDDQRDTIRSRAVSQARHHLAMSRVGSTEGAVLVEETRITDIGEGMSRHEIWRKGKGPIQPQNTSRKSQNANTQRGKIESESQPLLRTRSGTRSTRDRRPSRGSTREIQDHMQIGEHERRRQKAQTHSKHVTHEKESSFIRRMLGHVLAGADDVAEARSFMRKDRESYPRYTC
jgi:hypothetical protein